MLPIEICVEDRKKNGHRNTYQRSLKGDVTRNGFSATQCCNVGTILQPLETLSQQCFNAVLC